MSDHLPECPDTVQCVYDQNDQCWLEHSQCICEELHACEQRVRQEIDREAFVLDEGDPFRQAYRRGLDAARDAVKNVPCPEGYEAKGCSHWDDALAAIEALRGES